MSVVKGIVMSVLMSAVSVVLVVFVVLKSVDDGIVVCCGSVMNVYRRKRGDVQCVCVCCDLASLMLLQRCSSSFDSISFDCIFYFSISFVCIFCHFNFVRSLYFNLPRFFYFSFFVPFLFLRFQISYL
jgi:hypothetical protein